MGEKSKECKPQYFFSFSSGIGHSYCINSMYICDREVTEKEWIDFCKKYEDEVEQKIKTVPRLEIGGLDLQSKEYVEFKLWVKEHNPEEAFIALHNMRKVEHKELWRHKPHFEIIICHILKS